MRFILIFAGMSVLLILQAGILSNLGLGQIGNLLLVFVVLAVILSGFDESFFITLVGGVMLDLISASPVGTMVICFLAVHGVTHLIINKFVPREPNRMILFLCVGIGTLVFVVTFVLANQLLARLNLDSLADWRYLLTQKLFLDLITNIALAYPLYLYYLLVQKLQTRLKKLNI